MNKAGPSTRTLVLGALLLAIFSVTTAACREPQVETVASDDAPKLETKTFNSKKPQVLGPPVSVSMKEGFRSDEVEFTLAPDKGIEYMLDMQEGATLFYSIQSSSEDIRVDFHGHPKEAGDYPKGFWWRYASLGQEERHGKLVTPLDGLHGWYFGNRSDDEITIKLRVAGAYKELKVIK